MRCFSTLSKGARSRPAAYTFILGFHDEPSAVLEQQHPHRDQFVG
ncbi:hypothetical protein C4J99_2840 [Pseudomonas synxantha]|nr:hypothetical protein C4J99_2840 [Pseudomonas synxantha]